MPTHCLSKPPTRSECETFTQWIITQVQSDKKRRVLIFKHNNSKPTWVLISFLEYKNGCKTQSLCSIVMTLRETWESLSTTNEQFVIWCRFSDQKFTEGKNTLSFPFSQLQSLDYKGWVRFLLHFILTVKACISCQPLQLIPSGGDVLCGDVQTSYFVVEFLSCDAPGPTFFLVLPHFPKGHISYDHSTTEYEHMFSVNDLHKDILRKKKCLHQISKVFIPISHFVTYTPAQPTRKYKVVSVW